MTKIPNFVFFVSFVVKTLSDKTEVSIWVQPANR